MKIYLPFTHLRSETYLSAKAAIDSEPFSYFALCPLSDHEHGYADYWMNRWLEGETFINLEQDVVPVGGVLAAMWNCPEPYCRTEYSYPYAGAPIHTSPIGCAKFTSEFIARHHGIFVRNQHWHDPQHQILNASLNKGHVHDPPSVHLHINSDWPLDARRKYETPV